jgi:AAA+ ATPase superfamily predicted ATPase
MVRLFNRERELSILDDFYTSLVSSHIVLYGRRRVGKTELAREFIRNKKSISFCGYGIVKAFLGVLRNRWREFWDEVELLYLLTPSRKLKIRIIYKAFPKIFLLKR